MVRFWYSRVTSSERYASVFLFFLTVGIYLFVLSIVLALCRAYGRDPISALVMGVKDSTGYAILAEHLLTYSAFTGVPPPPYVPDVFRTPGYPFFLAIVLLLAGTPFAVPLVQILLVAVTSVLIFKLGKHLFSHRVGLIAALLYVLDPAAILLSFQYMTETLFMFLFVLFLFLFFRKPTQPMRSRSLFILGLLLGSITLVRPITEFLAPLVLVSVFLMEKERWRSPSLYRSLGTFVLGVMLLLGPWMIRNHVLAGGFQLSTVGPYTLYHYFALQYIAVKQRLPLEVVQTEHLVILTDGQPMTSIPPMEMSRRYSAFVRRTIQEDPIGYARFHLVKTLPFFISSSWQIPLDYYRSHIRQDPPRRAVNYTAMLLQRNVTDVIAVFSQRPPDWFYALEALARALLFPLSVLPLWFERDRRRIIVLFLFGLILYFAILTGPVSRPRYRLPAGPPLFLLGFWSVEWLVGRQQHARVLEA